VVRTHQGLIAQNHAIRASAPLESFRGPDLAIFANLTLANLGMGRGTIFSPSGWKMNHLRMLQDLPAGMRPETLSCGPTFLQKLLVSGLAPKTLRSIHVGGALTECDLFEDAFRSLPEARFLHVYGSSEAEPVAFMDARDSVQKSKQRGFVHALLTGRILPSLRSKMDDRTLWISGEHVCGEYLGNAEENLKSKSRDGEGRLWHAMGDRMTEDADGLWYQGRSFQMAEDFLLEQKIYRQLAHTRAFIFRDKSNLPVLTGEGIKKQSKELLKNFPEISRIQEKRIIRDRRHRARIDRGASQ
jgi:acyl-CoA synthetase (AMP-forming)/AMP-acid ligase II